MRGDKQGSTHPYTGACRGQRRYRVAVFQVFLGWLGFKQVHPLKNEHSKLPAAGSGPSTGTWVTYGQAMLATLVMMQHAHTSSHCWGWRPCINFHCPKVLDRPQIVTPVQRPPRLHFSPSHRLPGGGSGGAGFDFASHAKGSLHATRRMGGWQAMLLRQGCS